MARESSYQCISGDNVSIFEEIKRTVLMIEEYHKYDGRSIRQTKGRLWQTGREREVLRCLYRLSITY